MTKQRHQFFQQLEEQVNEDMKDAAYLKAWDEVERIGREYANFLVRHPEAAEALPVSQWTGSWSLTRQ